MAQLTCGSGGSSGAEVITQINTNTSDIASHSTRISSIETNLTSIQDTLTDHGTAINTNAANITTLGNRVTDLELDDPLAVMRLSNDVIVTLTDDPTPIILPVFDTVVAERGGFLTNLTNHALVSDAETSYTVVSIGFNVQFPGTEIMEMQVFVNDAPYSDADFYLKGDGTTRPVSFFWQSILPLHKGDVLDIRARNDASGSVDVTFLRTHFSIRSTSKELV